MTMLDDFLHECAAEVSRRAALADTQPAFAAGAQAFENALDAAAPIEATIGRVPATRHLESQLGWTSEIPWVATPRIGDDGANVALGLVNQVRDLGDFTCGLMLVGPNDAYPEHNHPPQEIYLPLSGDGMWRFGGSDDYRRLHADELVYNHPGDIHGAQAGTEPLLALYILWP